MIVWAVVRNSFYCNFLLINDITRSQDDFGRVLCSPVKKHGLIGNFKFPWSWKSFYPLKLDKQGEKVPSSYSNV